MSLWDLFLVFLKIGWLTLGGGYVMVPLFLEEIVKKRSWMNEDTFLQTLTLAQLFPGPIAFNLAVAVGYKLKKIKGAIMCGLAVVLPSFVSILVIAIFFLSFEKLKIVQGFFYGIRPAIASAMVVAVLELIKKRKWSKLNILSFTVLSILLIFFKINPIYIILISLGVVILWVYMGH
ncbi:MULTISPECIES: chromate transporter [Dictyoglomus]|jgi:chromate transporter|uniref:Chromate transporter n=1 Tax=Dictyoglomus turgidum (strain DSM 6724 / Z-1310) TaxID=515635 RepID=B8E1J6_DICTD|nr:MULTISPECIES: chromate transporter [Dictyoglomus]ACK41521.1 Chromate transporter [Dictyoglomus turgidum DSM 6724]PNV79392.1 MAG: chromate transporter [Dictyoglomus turgidum]HBU31912.1 chromate transporter [Dictyoglomus sp.]